MSDHDPKLDRIIKDGDSWLTPREYVEKYGHDCPISPIPWSEPLPFRGRWYPQRFDQKPYPPKKVVEE